MRTYEVLWRKRHSAAVESITVDAISKVHAENNAIARLLETPYNFVIVSVQESNQLETLRFPHGFHYWGGEIRNNAQWRKRW